MTDTLSQVTAAEAGADLDRLMQRANRIVGCVPPDSEPGVDAASWINITRFVEASSDDNPLYTDVRHGAASAHLTMLAPPTFVLAVHSPVSSGVLDRLPGHRLQHRLSALTLSWDDHVRLGDRILGRSSIAHVTRRAADEAAVGSVAEYSRAGVPFARASAEVELAVAGSAERRPIHRYEPDEIDRMVTRLDAEAPPRGGRPRFFRDVSVGEALPAVVRGPLSLSDLMVWLFAQGRPVVAGNLRHARLAALPGRSATNPVTGWPEWDRWEATLDSAVTDPAGPEAPGELLAVLAGQRVTNWMGDDAFLHRLTVRLDEPLLYGDTLWLDTDVVDRYRLTDDRRREYFAVALRVAGRNQLGDRVLEADAVVFLPEPGKPVELPITGGLTADEPLEG